MNNIYSLIDRLIEISIDNGMIYPIDEIYTRNRISALLKLDNYEDTKINLQYNLHETLNAMLDYSVSVGLIEDYLYEKDILSSKIMNVFLNNPSVINEEFYKKYASSPKEATDYFYNLSKNSNYIRTDRIQKNISYKTLTKYGNLDITINLSKPEKEPKEIAKQLTKEKSKSSFKYPKCPLCKENEGYEGRIDHADRSNHRMIEINTNNKDWYLQYSPYSYYNEHCIVISAKHNPMKISKDTFKNLLSFVEKFPHYFLGSNADIPIVGGSILSHEHYQGGSYEFPMEKAQDEYTFNLPKYSTLNFSILNWPLSTIRIRGKKTEDIVDATNYIFNSWKVYADKKRQILPLTKGENHNTITPIARYKKGFYEMDVVLRNNRTSKEHPLGIFHPHADVQHIKKENIGLIEVMGLAVLPGRLLNELEEIKDFILNKTNSVKEYHLTFAEDLKKRYNNEKSLDLFIKDEVGSKFARVLEDAGVFKRTDHGIEGFKKFISTLK
ncbi:UDP-glucose--hexose-1-phosphate uridylyltransferase [Clostridium algidicarnis]|uniref:UDP-glucose--hexose-1-phosphate uridylyltransferase n=1 Tax=Clostridium algidicarnis TaxID=37659 RepID=UPI001C0D1484|nr:UDP-glucose--hexose-1-phosphate uridylyltransferase [Clostridium algidicarnis]MBU3194912.1 UDP-glucose--hexose-1-phosphate uridylyltransferase [Clostridium algidicarnis]MCB2287500.1 UDP-glucose--hexose-1-phosphate uridylyltransferase [Clostridium algidicarnis]